MSNQRIIKNIFDYFNDDEEEENEESESSNKSEKVKKHKKSSSLNENANNNIKDKLSHTNREVIKKPRKRDEFGYFNNDNENNDENDNNEKEGEKSDSNDNREEDEISDKDNKKNDNQDKEVEDELNKSQKEEEKDEEREEEMEEEKEEEQKEEEQKEEEEKEEEEKEGEEEEKEEEEKEEIDDKNKNDNENENENKSEKENNQDNDNDILEEKSDKENKQNDNINNGEIFEKEVATNEEKIINEENQEHNNEKNELINELYHNDKKESLELPGSEEFRMGSFRPKPIPGSPKFSNRTIKDEETIVEKKEQNTNNNNNLTNFTETIETKIEGDKNNLHNETKIINPNINIYSHNNNIISLGKIPIKESNNINDKDKKVSEVIQKKSSEDEDKAEEDFLKREELKMRKNKENLEKKEEKTDENKMSLEKKEEKIIENNIPNAMNHGNEEDGKENVTEDEEEDLKNDTNIINSKAEKIKDTIQNEIKEDSKEISSSINSVNNDNANNKKNYNNEINPIKMFSIQLLEQMQIAGNSLNNSIKNSPKNSGSNNNNNINVNNNNIGINRNAIQKNIYSGNNKNNKNLNIIPSSKTTNISYESPSEKNIIKNNFIYSNDQNPNISTNKNISPFNYNNISISSKKLKVQNKKESRNINKDLFKDHDFKPKSYEKYYKNNNNINEKLPVRQKLSDDSRKINEKNINNCNINNDNKKQSKKKKQQTPLGLLLLYENANKIKEKKKQEFIRQNNNIIANTNIKKINVVSYKMVNNRLSKRIDNAINKFITKCKEKNEEKYKLNIVGMTQSLYELNIINELIKPKDNIKDLNNNNQIDLSELQAMVESVDKNDIKKGEEIELIEQLWILLNPKLETFFDCERLSIFLKIFLCTNYNPKELEETIIALLEQYKIYNIEKSEEYQSPLRAKIYSENQIWSLDIFIKVFSNLKQNLIAYRENDYTKGDVYNNIMKESEKDLTFEPNFDKSKYFYKYSNFQYNKDNSIIDIINKFKNSGKKTKHDFNKVYERFKAEKELREKNLQRIREIQREKELKECTNVPKINKYRPPSKSPNKSQLTKDKNDDSILDTEKKILQNKKSFIKEPIYKRLYNLRKKHDKSEKKQINKDDIVDENCTFKPKISDNEIMNKTFSNMKKKPEPKGFNDYVDRNRSLLKKKEEEKKLEEDKKYGRGYDKIQKLRNDALNRLEKSFSKDKNNIKYIDTEPNNQNKYFFEKGKNNAIIDNIYITLDIKLSNGIIKPLKIYNKSDKDTIEDIYNFCKAYSLSEEFNKILIKKAMNYKYNFYGKN